MEIKRGIAVSPGIAIGEAFVLDYEDYRIPKRFVNNDPQIIENEIKRYKKAVFKSVEELKKIEADTKNMRDISIIFRGHRFIIEDFEIQKEIMDKIQNSLFTAEYAVANVMQKHRTKLQSFQSEHYTRRLNDLEDIENRILRHLLDAQKEDLANLQNPVILVAKDLTPSQTAILPQKQALAFITEIGGSTSHTAIVARTRGIPAVVGMSGATAQICGGDTLIVDGSKGLVIVNPSQTTINKYCELQNKENIIRQELLGLVELPVETIDGYNISLMANIEDPSEVKIAIENGASGIGLYRTEFIYINKPNPDEETHLASYKHAIKLLGDRKLTIRTFDFGADKTFGLNEFKGEQNPFLGCRSIRLCFEKLSIFKPQLRAILRASNLGNVEIMFPMISSLEELLHAKKILNETKKELKEEGISYNENIKIGMMIEIPSAALTADILIKEVDFFSIGTNDLIQYTLAVDRINERVATLYKPAHPAIFRLIKNVVDIAKKNRKRVSMCGEMSGEFSYIIPLIGLGLRDISLSPAIIPKAKQMIRKMTMRQAFKISQKIFTSPTHQDTIKYLSCEIPYQL